MENKRTRWEYGQCIKKLVSIGDVLEEMGILENFGYVDKIDGKISGIRLHHWRFEILHRAVGGKVKVTRNYKGHIYAFTKTMELGGIEISAYADPENIGCVKVGTTKKLVEELTTVVPAVKERSKVERDVPIWKCKGGKEFTV